jgi:CheY-like chemotaxis protein
MKETSKALGTILLGEDNRINSQMVCEYLMARGYSVVTAGNGWEVLEKAAEFMPGDQERCLEAGVNEYLSKPVSLKMLVQTIAKLINSSK